MQRNFKHILAGLLASAAIASAQPAWSKAVPIPPDRVSTFSGAYLAARVAESDRDIDSAISFYKQALGYQPNNQSIQQNLMLALVTRGRFDEAIPYAEKLKTVAEVERVSRLVLAINDFRKSDFKGAQNWLQLALESDLDRLIVNLMTGWAKQGDGDNKGALELLSRLKGPDWYAIFLNYHRALIAEAGGRKAEAEQSFTAALDGINLASAAPDAYLRSAEAYAGFLAREGRKAEALKVIERAEAFSPSRLQIKALRAKIEKGEPVPVLIPGPLDGASEVLLNLGMALNRSGAEPFVKVYLQLSLALKPDNDFALMNLAELYETESDAQDAIDLYARVAAGSPFKRLAEMQTGLNLADIDKKDEAVTHLKKLVADDPDDMRAYLALGGVYSSKDDYRSAANTYDEAVARLKNPTRADYNIYYQRGIAHERLKEWDKAEPNFRKALELFPNQPQVMNYLGYSWVDMDRNLEEGLELIRKAVDLRPSDGYIVDSLGWAYYRLGRYDEAVTELERAVSLRPEDPVLNDHLGDAYFRAGRRLEATFQWNHARDLKPEPDVLANVQKKLIEGLPPLDKTEAAAPKAETPAVPAPAAPAPEQKSEETPPKPLPPAAQPAESPPVVPAAYIVQRGQSLWSIAVERLGNGARYREILELNPHLSKAGPLMPGTEIKLPGS